MKLIVTLSLMLFAFSAFASDTANCIVSMEDQLLDDAFIMDKEYVNVQERVYLALPESSSVLVKWGLENDKMYIMVQTKEGDQKFIAYGSDNSAKIFIENRGEPNVGHSLYQLTVSCQRN